MGERESYSYVKFFFEKFQKHVYNTEDSLYQILYDKQNRPEIYWNKLNSSKQGEQDKFELQR